VCLLGFGVERGMSEAFFIDFSILASWVSRFEQNEPLRWR